MIREMCSDCGAPVPSLVSGGPSSKVAGSYIPVTESPSCVSSSLTVSGGVKTGKINERCRGVLLALHHRVGPDHPRDSGVPSTGITGGRPCYPAIQTNCFLNINTLLQPCNIAFYHIAVRYIAHLDP